jgi:signal transduction histidine kinase
MAKQEERQRIAAGVHDDLGADISHLLMLTRESAASETLDQGDRDNLRNIEMNASGIMQKVDEIIWSLDPRDDEGSNALGFIQSYAEAFADAHNMVFRTQILPELGETRIPPADRREVYLIVKELLNNIGKHTQATELRIVFRVTNGLATIVIDDNGEPIGAATLSANKLRRGHGLANMQERIARLSGTLRAEGLEPVGTRVTITFPLRATVDEGPGLLTSPRPSIPS